MRRGGSKSKGGNFEREICKKLSLWVSKGSKKDLFWRSAMSGGRSTVARKKGEALNRQAGDICSVSPEGHSLTDRYFIECKHYKNLGLNNFFFNGRGILAEFWKKVLFESEHYKKAPMLIAKQNLVPTMLITNVDALEDFLLDGIIVEKHDESIYCSIYLFNDVMNIRYSKLGLR